MAGRSQKKQFEPCVPSNVRLGRGRGDRRNVETIVVDKKWIPRIIGRGGAKIKELQRQSGATISTTKNYEGDRVPIELSGSESAIHSARLLIEQMQLSCGNGNGSGYSRGDRRNFNTGTNVNPTDKTIRVEASQCGRIVGRGGSKIRELQEQTGTRIEVKRNQTSNNMTPVIIRGDGNSIAAAEKLINEILNEVKSTTQQQYHFEEPREPKEDTFIDWDGMNTLCAELTRQRWAKLEAIKKNFYIEDNDIAAMSLLEVDEWRKQNNNITITHLAEENKKRDVLNPVMTFEHAFKHYPEVLDTIHAQNFKKPSPIQSQVWPLAMRGFDVIGIAQTETSQTLEFLLPIFLHIDGQSVPRSERKGPSCLILAPTTELALQIEMEIKKYQYRGIRCVCVYGDGDRRQQINLIKQGVEIIVATPGRLSDLVSNENVCLDSVTFLVLDEADRMLDMGLEPQIMKILLDVRPDHQSIMTSATWSEEVRRWARSYLTDPMQVTVGSLDLAAVHSVTQTVEVVAQEEKLGRVFDFIDCMEKTDKVLIFAGRKAVVAHIASELALKNIVCQAIHGGREQYDREQALSDFKSGVARILVATDAESRGLDVADITHVFNCDYPRNTEEYVHRVGRTGRAGKSRHLITLVTAENWRSAKELVKILAEANQYVPIELQEMADRTAKMNKRIARGDGHGMPQNSSSGDFELVY